MAKDNRPLRGLDKESLKKLADGSQRTQDVETPAQQHHGDLTQAEARDELRRQAGEEGQN